MSTLNSKIRICKGIKLDKNYNNTLSYHESDILSLCESQDHLIASSNTYSFIRTRGVIQTGFTYSQGLQANYMAFQNPDYDNKWFFAFVDNVNYMSNGCAEFEYTIDVWSTWWDYWHVGKCFVLREHAESDTIGEHTIPENLDIGEVYCEQETEDASYYNTTYWIGMLTNYVINDNSTESSSDKGLQFAGAMSVYNNVVFGNQLIFFPIYMLSSFNDIRLYILRTNVDGYSADIQNIFIIPNAVMPLASSLVQHTASVVGHDFNWYTASFTDTPATFNTTITKRHSFTGYTPKNNKCFVYPYNYLLVTNNQGSHNIYKYEDFDTTNCVFQNQMAISVGISGRLVPKNYKGMITNDDEALPLGKYPTCAWSSDAYINWLTQNSVNLAVNTTTSLIGAGIGFASGVGVASTTLGLFNSIGNTIDAFHKASLLPNIEGGQPTGDVTWASNRNCFTFKEMRAKIEYIKIIDDFFTRYGYRMNRVKVPNLYGRTYWNYIQIDKDDNVGYGTVPSMYMEEINNIARKGTTIWHNHADIGNFSLNNTIVT